MKFSWLFIFLTAPGILSMGGCAGQHGMFGHAADAKAIPGMSQQQFVTGMPSGLLLHTSDQARVFFHDDQWRLTLRGISGRADIMAQDGVHYRADTTITWQVTESAQATGRSNTMKQFMLTVLGVILVLGLAGIILYAAFLATDR